MSHQKPSRQAARTLHLSFAEHLWLVHRNTTEQKSLSTRMTAEFVMNKFKSIPVLNTYWVGITEPQNPPQGINIRPAAPKHQTLFWVTRWGKQVHPPRPPPLSTLSSSPPTQ